MAAASAVSKEETNEIKSGFVRKDPTNKTYLNEINKDYFVVGSGASSSVVRKLQSSNYLELIGKYANKSEKWRDYEFPYVFDEDIYDFKRIEEIM